MNETDYPQNLTNFCRLCFSEENALHAIFGESNLSSKIKECTGIEVLQNEEMPSSICKECFKSLRNWMRFKEKCVAANLRLTRHFHCLKTKQKSSTEEDTDHESLVPDPYLKEEAVNEDLDAVNTRVSASNKKLISDQERRALYRKKYNQYQRKTYSCDVCDKQFTRFCDLFNHDKIDHEDLPRNSMCNVCGKLFVSENRVQIHKKRYHCEKPFICDVCSKRFLTKRTLQKHMIIHNKCYKCPYCDLSTSSNSSLVEHIRVHTREKPFTCDECGNSYISQQGLNSHKKTHSFEKLFMCDICGYSARNQSSIYIHKGSHSNVKPFICETCGKAFKSKIRLNEHHRRHSAVKRFTCDTCNISFRQNYQLVKHYRVHSGEKPYSCDLCSRNFARSDSLKEHKRIHTGEKRYTCQTCLKAFSFLKPFKTHTCVPTT